MCADLDRGVVVSKARYQVDIIPVEFVDSADFEDFEKVEEKAQLLRKKVSNCNRRRVG